MRGLIRKPVGPGKHTSVQLGAQSNIGRWIGHPRFELIRQDVTEPIKLELDRIWYLACPATSMQPGNGVATASDAKA